MKTCVLLSGWVNLRSQSLKTSLKGFKFCQYADLHIASQSAFTFPKLTIETLEQGVKFEHN